MVEEKQKDKNFPKDVNYPFERMQDPVGDRVLKDLPKPPRYPLKFE